MGNPNTDSISLLFPITIELTNNEIIIFKENINILLNMNFNIAEFGINSLIVKAHPIWLPAGYEEEAIRKIIDLIVHREKDFTIEKFNESVATMLSCKLAIKANENITHNEQESLINDLRKCDNPFNCPHGRPTIIFYSKYDLEKLFKRSGFEQYV
jgi:DNA mismatch repair protein MutL